MIEEYTNCPLLGEIKIKSLDISYLFLKHKSLYMKVFNVEEDKFLNMKKFKELKGGLLIEVTSGNNLLAIFTLSNGENNFLELGDIIKVKFKFLRKTFAEALSIACEKSIIFLKKDGIYGYPNRLAKNLELLAGFKIFKLYKRNVYLTFLNLKFLLPFKIYDSKIHTKFNYFLKFPLSINKYRLAPTGSKKLNLRVYKNTNLSKNLISFLFFGFIYEFEIADDFGDPFIIFGNSEFPLNKIDFQFTDNSA